MLSLSDKMTFGKHKGLTVQQAIDKDADYIAWAWDEIDWFDLDREAEMYLDEALLLDDDEYSWEEEPHWFPSLD